MTYDKVAGAQTLVVPIQNGRATLPNLRPGVYGVESGPDPDKHVGFKPSSRPLRCRARPLTSDALQQLSTGVFSAVGVASMNGGPQGWRVANGKLPRGAGHRVTRKRRLSLYSDFQSPATSKWSTGGRRLLCASRRRFAELYLVQWTGRSSSEPYKTAWLCRE